MVKGYDGTCHLRIAWSVIVTILLIRTRQTNAISEESSEYKNEKDFLSKTLWKNEALAPAFLPIQENLMTG